MIPKIIHQTWKTKDIPDQWENAVFSCIEKNIDFKYILWTHETMDKFVQDHYFWFYETYKSYKYHIQRCDAFRYLVLYKYGGVYLDLDIICNENLNNFLDYELVLVKSYGFFNSFTNSFFMVIPGHPFFKHCITNLSNNINSYQYFGKHLHVMNSAGPLFLNKMINEYGEINNMRILKQEEFAGDCNFCNENTCKGGIYFTHLRGHSWHGIDSTIYNFLFCNKVTIIIVLLVIFYYKIKKYNKKNIINLNT